VTRLSQRQFLPRRRRHRFSISLLRCHERSSGWRDAASIGRATIAPIHPAIILTRPQTRIACTLDQSADWDRRGDVAKSPLLIPSKAKVRFVIPRTGFRGGGGGNLKRARERRGERPERERERETERERERVWKERCYALGHGPRNPESISPP